MSPIDTRRSTHAATVACPSGQPIPRTPGGGNTSALDYAFMERALAKDPYPPLPVTPARVTATPNAGPYRCTDPSNYLG
jgi:hypothetical protein